MPSQRNEEYLGSLLRELCALPGETEWVEFKENKAEPQEIGEYISALSNSAALLGKANAYLIWGVRDLDHAITDTSFDFTRTKVGNEDLENWLLRALTPKIHFNFYTVQRPSQRVVILEIERASRNPVQFQGVEFIRVGSYKKKLKDHPEHERRLWRIFDRVPFETSVAADRLTENEVLALLDYTSFFELLSAPYQMVSAASSKHFKPTI